MGADAGTASLEPAPPGGTVMAASRDSFSPLPLPDPVEAEFAKDIWDVRRIPGARYSPCRNAFFLIDV